MIFSSITFLYFFLPFVLLLNFIVRGRGRNLFLFVVSVLFYAWGEPKFVFLMLAEIVFCFFMTGLKGKVFYALSVIVPFGLLFFFKFSDTFPIGISFYTFQLVSYCIDVHRGRVERQKNLITLAAYVTLFPQLVAGPIVRYSDVEGALVGVGREKSDSGVSFEYGVMRFVLGLGKKVLLANVLGEFVAEVSGLSGRGLLASWCYAVAVALQIYFDFSGYSDMAIGLGAMLGFRFPENFRYPFISGSIGEFWRRWHITLGAWFRDYVYIPMGGSRVGFVRWIFNVLVVWAFTGLWHGAEWNFVLWGLMFAGLLVFEKMVKRAWERIGGGFGNGVMAIGVSVVRHVYVLWFVIVSFLVFHNTGLGRAVLDVASLVNCGGLVTDDANVLMVSGFMVRNRFVVLAVGIVAATPLPAMVWGRFCRWIAVHKYGRGVLQVVESLGVVVILGLCTAYIIDGSFNPFLYFRF